MKPRTWIITSIGLGLLAVAIAAYGLRSGYQGEGQVLAATVNRDCAPWDGPAFTVSIPVDAPSQAVILVSIWQSPDIAGPAAFAFPDRMGRTGNASLIGLSGQEEPLSGRVILRGADQGQPVEGSFDLMSETGSRFEGRLSASWGEQRALCG
jgi:hypothetical protein